MKSALIALALVACMVASSEAVECYVCTSALNDACGDSKFDADAADTVDCGDTVTGCLKGKVDQLVTRSCSVAGDDSDSCTDVTALGITTWACACQGEKCNGSATLSLSVGALMAALLTALVTKQ